METIVNQYKPESVTHPGLTLEEKLEELRMGNKEFAVRVDKPEKTITAVLSGKSAITPEMAVKFEDVLKIPATFWLNRQRRYDEYRARLERVKDIESAADWAKEFPYAKMASLGWVPKTRDIHEKVTALFDFFGVSNQKAWENYYFNQELKVSFRISLAHTNGALAIAAWLRQGENQSQDLEVPAYDTHRLKGVLPQIKNLMAEHPNFFFNKLQDLCGQAGVKVVYTPCLPKAPVHGSTRWLGDIPLIQLSARYKTNDKFWFTFFHEVGHILLHGKKYISIENVSYNEQDKLKEKEADDFAIGWIFSEKEEQEVLKATPLSTADIP